MNNLKQDSHSSYSSSMSSYSASSGRSTPSSLTPPLHPPPISENRLKRNTTPVTATPRNSSIPNSKAKPWSTGKISAVSIRLDAIRKNSFSNENPISQRNPIDSKIENSYPRETNVSSEDAMSDTESDPQPNIQQTMRFEQISNVKPKSVLKINDQSKISGIKPIHGNKVKLPDNSQIGFSNLPNQLYRKALKKGFEFVLLVVGETGLGKSTLINSMFLTDIYTNKDMVKMERTVEVGTHQVMLEEDGVKLSLTVVDTPGYGDAVDNTDCWEPVVEYVEEQFDKFLEAETRVKRESLPDSRVHACLYFIAPSGHGLKRIDVEFMKRIHDKVNIIPVIGKADACTREEIELFKQKIMDQIQENEISVFQFPEEDDDPKPSIMSKLPFAVVGSNVVVTNDAGDRVRGRRYPWGTVNIEDQAHCDFSLLRDLLLCQHMQDLMDVTNSIHYELYRSDKLSRLVYQNQEASMQKKPTTIMEDEQQGEFENVEKMENEMDEIFSKKVDEKIEKMRISEKEEDQNIEKQMQELNLEKSELDFKRHCYQKEKYDFEHSLSFNTNSLGRRKKYNFSVGPLKFGRQ